MKGSTTHTNSKFFIFKLKFLSSILLLSWFFITASTAEQLYNNKSYIWLAVGLVVPIVSVIRIWRK